MFTVNPLGARAPRSAMLFLILGAFMISFSGVWVKISHVTPTASAFYRALFGTIILLAAASWRRELKWPGGRNFLAGFVCGLFLALDLVFYHTSIHYVGPGLGTILPSFQVIILAILGYFFLKEKVRVSFVVSIPLAFLGLLMIIGIDWGQLGRVYQLGVYCGLAAAACYAGFILSLRKLQTNQVGESIFFVLMMVSFATAALLAAEIHRIGDTFRIPDIQSLLALLALGLFSQSLGWILITNALPHIRASLSGFVLLLQPALAFLWDVLLFQRPTTLMNWVGVFVALSAIYIGTAKSTHDDLRADIRKGSNKIKSPKKPA